MRSSAASDGSREGSRNNRDASRPLLVDGPKFSFSFASTCSKEKRPSLKMPKLARQNRLASSSTRKALNPLNALLREKRAADKRGTSSTALRLAENAVRQECQREPSINSSHDPLFHLGFMDEQAAWRAVHHFQACHPPQTDQTNAEDYVLGPRQTRMLGSEAGAAISKIFANDRIEKGKEKARVARREKALGVPLWKIESSDDIDVDRLGSILTDASFGHGSLILDLIDQLHGTGSMFVPRRSPLSSLMT